MTMRCLTFLVPCLLALPAQAERCDDAWAAWANAPDSKAKAKACRVACRSTAPLLDTVRLLNEFLFPAAEWVGLAGASEAFDTLLFDAAVDRWGHAENGEQCALALQRLIEEEHAAGEGAEDAAFWDSAEGRAITDGQAQFEAAETEDRGRELRVRNAHPPPAKGATLKPGDRLPGGPIVHCTGAGCAQGNLGQIAWRPALRVIPAGRFVMGSPKEEAGRGGDELAHEVTLTEPLMVMETEVTPLHLRTVQPYDMSELPECLTCPLGNVTWHQAIELANLLSQAEGLTVCYQGTQRVPCTGYRLPTEAEWEYFARAGTLPTQDDGWFAPDAEDTTQPVGTKNANAWGLHDVFGNVWEWCEDWKGPYPADLVVDPTGPATGQKRVIRGGSFAVKPGPRLRPAYRDERAPDDRSPGQGFRLVRAVPVGQCDVAFPCQAGL